MTDGFEIDRFAIRLTARLRRGRYAIEINGCEILLTDGQFRIIVELIKARRRFATGYAWLEQKIGVAGNTLHVAIKRLRAAIDDVLGKGVGKALITHAKKDAYFLEVTPSAIQIDPDVEELAPSHLTAKDVLELLGS